MCFDKMAMRKHKRSGYLTEYEKLLDKAKDNTLRFMKNMICREPDYRVCIAIALLR